MVLVGLSLVLASVVYAAIWKPSFIQTFLSIWRGDPQIQQPPTSRRPAPAETRGIEEDQSTPMETRENPSSSTSAPVSQTTADQAGMPPPPLSPKPTTPTRTGVATSTSPSQSDSTPSPQTTPRAAPSLQLDRNSIPSFTLSPSPPASAAALARTAEAQTVPPVLPTFSAPSPPLQQSIAAGPSPPAWTSMRPPPRPPTLNAINNNGPLLGVPARGPAPNRQQHQYDRQPGTSTLAPPPTLSSKPNKPSRKVTLEPGRSPLDWARLANNPSSDLRNIGPAPGYLRVTPSLLKRYTGRKGKDAWTALGGRVYNITPYLPFHPGGEPELLRVAGRDGSKLFGEIHPWVNYETMLAACMIGLLVEEHEGKSTGEMDAMD
ncbi:hypothetical protein F4804DRAFT_74483 [Jackrogersella minutella]|nr:hypothetical protein F4804DRAFT_74483 [Jackrogersella minutella]